MTQAHAAVGDSAETATLLLDERETAGEGTSLPLHRWLEERILPLRGQSAEQQYAEVAAWWQALSRAERLVLNKLLTGGLRAGVSDLLVVRALAAVSGLPRATLSHRLSGDWRPSAAAYRALIAKAGADDDRSRPYPFLLASPLEVAPADLGSRDDWLVEWQWDGIPRS